jgi:hypothetical protein
LIDYAVQVAKGLAAARGYAIEGFSFSPRHPALSR